MGAAMGRSEVWARWDRVPAMKIKQVKTGKGEHYGYRFECPGCGEPHVVPTKPSKLAWDFNDNMESPTFSPSILVHPHGTLNDDGTITQTHRCHSFVRDGRIEFCSDSTHALAGQTVDLPDVFG